MFAVLGLWIHRNVWIGGLFAAVVTAYFTGVLYGFAFFWIALLFLVALSYRLSITNPGFGVPPWSLLLVFAALTMWLALSPPQGFPRTPFVDSVRLSPDAVVWSMGLGFPKVVPGILIFGFMHPERVRSWRELGVVLKRVTPMFLFTLAGLMVIAVALGNVRFDPKWTPLFLVWAPVNLLFTVMAEEAFFRGLVQRGLNALGSNRRQAAIFSIAAASLLYGLVHYSGGWNHVVVQALVGASCGWAYHRTQRLEAAMAVQFGIDVVQFLLFTFPALESGFG